MKQCIKQDQIGDIHYNDVIMSAVASQITSVSIVCSAVGSGVEQRKHQSSVSLAFVWGIHRWPVNSPHKWSVTRKMFPFGDVIMYHHVSIYLGIMLEPICHSDSTRHAYILHADGNLFYFVLSCWRHQNGNIFRVTGSLCGKFTGHRWIPRTKASDAELWCFLWSAPEQTFE